MAQITVRFKPTYMYKLLLLVAVMMAATACINHNSKKDQNQGDNIGQSQTTGPDASDLLKTLQGRWQNRKDSTYILEIADTQMRHFYSGKLQEESEIDVDGACATSPCVVDSTTQLDGWCFTEKDKQGTRCFIIVACDKDSLKYSPVDAESDMMVFKKVF
jgi:hypothetical protein